MFDKNNNFLHQTTDFEINNCLLYDQLSHVLCCYYCPVNSALISRPSTLSYYFLLLDSGLFYSCLLFLVCL